MSRPSEPFNAEERDLAQRLARLGGPREPAAPLDAIILAAAARAAVSETVAPAAAPPAEPETGPTADPKVTPLRPHKPAPRWPVGFGLAASVVLAAGIGWRLQIDGDTHSEAASAPAAVFREDATEAVMLEPPLQRTPPPPPPPLEETDALARRVYTAQAPAAKAAPAPREPEFAADAAAPRSVMAEAPPPPAPPPAPVATTNGGSPVADDSLDEVTVTGTRIQRERATGAAEYTRTPLNERREQAAQAAKPSPPATASPSRTAASAPASPPASGERARGLIGNVESDAEEHKFQDKARKSDAYDDRPPVSADSPEFRQAWLQRIRAQIAKGDTDTARNGLQEFRRRYPDIELPEDLRKLAATLPPPAP